MRKILLFPLFLLLAAQPVFAGFAINQVQLNAGASFADNTVRFVAINGAIRSTNLEALRQVPIRAGAGTFSSSRVFVSQNDVGSNSTVTLRVAGADSAIVITVTANATGLFSNTSSTASTTAGQLVNWEVTVPSVSGSHTIAIKNIYTSFDADSNTFGRLSGHILEGGTTPSIPSAATRYSNAGGDSVLSLTEAPVQFKYRSAGTLQSLLISNGANTSNFAVTVTARIGGADVTNTLSIPGGGTGVFEDSTHSDSIAAGDLVSVGLVAGVGTGTCEINIVGIEFTTTNNKSHAYQTSPAVALTAASTYYFSPTGGTITATTNAEDDSVFYTFPFTATASNLQLYVVTNLATGDGTFDLRQNAGSSAVTISVTGLGSGLFEDASNSVSLSINDDINYRFIVGTGSTTTVSLMGMMLEDTTVSAARKNQVIII